MGRHDFSGRVRRIGALAEPIRRELYQYVVAQERAVSRDEAAAGVGVPRHTAKFHLDRLADEGLLETESRRLSGRTGPGAGRPTKLFRRAPGEVSVSLPERRYELAGALMAEAIATSAREDVPVLDALRAAALTCGTTMGQAARANGGEAGTVAAMCTALADLGYEPRASHGEITLVNCPFHALAREHTDLVCGMNLALLEAASAAVGSMSARLEPREGRCCVVLALEVADGTDTS